MSDPQPKPPPLTVRPLDAYPAAHATNAFCALDGGAFVIHFYENRQVTPALVGEAFKNENRALVEVAKIALSPSAIQYLRESMTACIAAHEASAGKMLTPAEYDKRIGEHLNKSLVDSAERLLKPPDQDPSS